MPEDIDTALTAPAGLSRRDVIMTAAAAAVATGTGAALAAPTPARIRLRLLETSDLHMFIYDYDYFRDKPDETVGFAKTAGLIEAARREAPNSLLFDNGDIIQGNPLSDYVAARGAPRPGTVHPMFRAMNLLGYDAATLGNHEFNYGLPYLDRSLSGARFPFVSANLDHADGKTYLPPYVILDRTFVALDGTRHKLKVGVIGFVPPQILIWDRSNLIGRVVTHDIVEAAQRHVPVLRRKCDLLVALCHSGINAQPRQGGDENASLYLAEVPGIDVIFTGHSHRVFPGPDYADRPGVDALRGTLHGVPAVMPGFWGSHLGVIDLTLEQRGSGWAVSDFTVEARPIYRRQAGGVESLVTAAPAVLKATQPEHQATLDYIRQPVGRTEVPINSFLAVIGDDPSLTLVNQAQIWYATPLLAASHPGIPVLSAASPFKAGGGMGPENFTDIPAGPLAIKNLADIYLYPNTVRVVLIDGATVGEWLERGANLFHQIDPAATGPQPLLAGRAPTYNFDVIQGVTYAIDLSQPARYDAEGHLIHPEARRIRDLMFQGQPIDPAQPFLVVTNNYRAAGGGGFPRLDGSTIVLEAPDSNRDAILRYVQSVPSVRPTGGGVWRFAKPPRPVTLTFDTSPLARPLLADHPGLHEIATAPGGFMTVGLDLA